MKKNDYKDIFAAGVTDEAITKAIELGKAHMDLKVEQLWLKHKWFIPFHPTWEPEIDAATELTFLKKFYENIFGVTLDLNEIYETQKQKILS